MLRWKMKLCAALVGLGVLDTSLAFRSPSPISAGRYRRKVDSWRQFALSVDEEPEVPIWEKMAEGFVGENFRSDPEEMKAFINYVTFFKVGMPSLLAGAIAGSLYPAVSLWTADLINDPMAFDVIANDYSQYIQNILTTCGLMFSIITGYTYYFLYQQQEAIYNALFEEVTVAKSLLEQVALVAQGRIDMYKAIIRCIDRYVNEDLIRFDVEPSVLLSRRPVDDPLEEIMFLTSVGEPSIIYSTVKALRQARAFRLGALQRKLPPIHSVLLCSLAAVVLFTFPVLGAGSQTIAGDSILKVQGFYIFIIVFGITMVLGVLNELNDRAGKGAYNVESVLAVMVSGLQDELEGRLQGKYAPNFKSPTVDGIPRSPSDDSRMQVYIETKESRSPSGGSVAEMSWEVGQVQPPSVEDTPSDLSMMRSATEATEIGGAKSKNSAGSRIMSAFKRVSPLHKLTKGGKDQLS